MKLVKIIKGVAFIISGMIMFSIKFYNINPVIVLEDTGASLNFSNPMFVAMYFERFFEQSGINLILALLFIGIGVLELIEIKGVLKNVH